jgi:hypothetical protein
MVNEKPIPESKALPPRDPAVRDENEWPIFHLRGVEVTSRSGKIASLLHADPTYPVTVTGTLEKSKANLCMVQDQPRYCNPHSIVSNAFCYL